RLYNGALEERRNYYWRFGKGLLYNDQCKGLTELRQSDTEWAEPPIKVLRSALDRLDKAYKAFFRRCKAGEKPGFPRFKGQDRYDSFSLMSDVPKVKDSRVHLPKLGPVKFREYRPLPVECVKDVRVKRE